MVQALLYKARVKMQRASAAPSADPAAWTEARRWIVKANRLSPDDAEALSLYYDSYAAQHVPPSKSAIAGVARALELVSQDPELRFKVATQQVLDGDGDVAKRTLRPLAFDPHMPGDNPAARLIAILDAGTTGPAALQALGKPTAEGARQ